MTTNLRRTLTLAAVLLAAGPAGLAEPPAAHAAERSCGNVELADGSHVEVRVDGTTCRVGRRILSIYATSDAPCGGNSCARRHHGWGCASATPALRPRLFSCAQPTAHAVAFEMRDRVNL